MKIRSKKDSTEKTNKIKLIESMNINSYYNIFADSFNFSNVSYSLPLQQKANWPVIGDIVRAGNLPAQVQSHVPFHVPGVLEGLFVSACVFFYEKDSYSGLLTLKNHVGEHYFEGLSAYFHFCILKEDSDSWLEKYWASSSTE